jgi:hypothetical protein
VISAAVGRRRVVLAAGALVALVVAGCAGQADSTAQPLAPAAPGQGLRSPGIPDINPRWRSCANEPSAQRGAADSDAFVLPRLSDTFRPVAAIICAETTQRRPDGGTDAVAIEDRVDDLTMLLLALGLPDEPPLSEPAADDESPVTGCNLIGYIAPSLVLLDAQGRWVRPGIPTATCGGPRGEVTKAMDTMRRTRIATRVLHEAESAEAAAAGCGDTWADMVWVTGTDSTTKSAELAELADDGEPVRMCLYRVTAAEQRTDKPRGDFISGGLLPADRWAVIKRQVRAAGPAKPCSTPASRFVLLRTPADVYVELDGCLRILAPAAPRGDGTSSDTLLQAPAALPGLLAKP